MPSSVWHRLQSQLQQELDPDEFSTWFAPLRVRSEEKNRLELLAPNNRFVTTLEESYRGTVDRAVAGLEGPAYKVLFTVQGEPRRPAVQQAAFNSRYEFESFVVGSSNQFAHAAARAIAENPARSYNPLFLYGGVGLGKTHLLHAIGHTIQRRYPQLRVMYLPAEQFVNELISSLRFNRMPDFRERYRNIDFLCRVP